MSGTGGLGRIGRIGANEWNCQKLGTGMGA